MLKRLLFLLLIYTCAGKADAQQVITPFEDYTKCYIGFRIGPNDTLWPAQFEAAHKSFDQYTGILRDEWIVKYQGHFGVLDRFGKIIVPFEYDELFPAIESDAYIMEKAGKQGIVKHDGTVVVEAIYDRIDKEFLYQQCRFYTVYRNDKSGVMNSNYKLIIDTEYTFIDFLRFDDQYYDGVYNVGRERSKYFRVSNDTLLGIIDTSGRTVLPMHFDELEPYYMHSYAQCPTKNVFWITHLKDKGYGVCSEDGKELLKPMYTSVSLQYVQQDSCAQGYLYFAHLTAKNSYGVADLETGKKSAFYEELQECGRYHLYTNGKQRGVLDEELNELPVKTKYDLALFSQRAFLNDDYHYSEGERYYGLAVMDQQNIGIKEVKTDPRYSTKGRKPRKGIFYGLYNYRTQKVVKPIYHIIGRKVLNGVPYYWALYLDNEEMENGTLSIFNIDLELISKQVFSLISLHDLDKYFSCDQSSERAFVFKNEKGLFGGINARGEVLLPFEFTKAQAHGIVNNQTCYEHNWIVEKNGLSGYRDLHGKEILPTQYKALEFQHSTFVKVLTEDGYSLLDSTYNTLVGKCDRLFIGYSSGLNAAKLNKKTYGHYLQNNVYYAIRKDTLYALQGDHFVKIDSTYLRFSQAVQLVAEMCLVRPDGSLIAEGERIVKVGAAHYGLQTGTTAVFYNLQGIEVNRMEGIRYFNQNSNWLDIQGVDKRWGVVDLQTAKTLLRPIYASVSAFFSEGKRVEDRYWISDVMVQNGKLGSWKLINGAGEMLIEKPVDFTFSFDRTGLTIFRSQNSFGLINKDLKIVVPTEYHSIVQMGTAYFLKRDSWSAYSPEKGIVDLKAYYLGIDIHPKGWIVYGYQTVGVLGKNLEWILPLTTIEKVKKSENLAQLLGISGYDAFRGERNSFYLKDTSNIGRLINNEHILEISEARSTKYRLFERTLTDYRMHPNYGIALSELRDLEIIIQKKDKNYLSVTRKRKSTPWNDFVGNRYNMDYWKENRIEHTNYRLSDTSMTKIELRDIFKEGSSFAPKIDEVLTTYINKKQLFGMNCVNLPQILDNYKKCFYLSGDSIVFCQPNSQSNEIKLKLEVFKEMLR